ncbi:translation initiation factor IF-2-like [Mustela erminea]|uniref:translation initiation factor IF-2-like n=1 Tax=Mustela erminea TaxID=36723 RepID=UPI001386BDE2|nr:translation initiation factor IF-2-like [Mustela erminea]
MEISPLFLLPSIRCSQRIGESVWGVYRTPSAVGRRLVPSGSSPRSLSGSTCLPPSPHTTPAPPDAAGATEQVQRRGKTEVYRAAPRPHTDGTLKAPPTFSATPARPMEAPAALRSCQRQPRSKRTTGDGLENLRVTVLSHEQSKRVREEALLAPLSLDVSTPPERQGRRQTDRRRLGETSGDHPRRPGRRRPQLERDSCPEGSRGAPCPMGGPVRLSAARAGGRQTLSGHLLVRSRSRGGGGRGEPVPRAWDRAAPSRGCSRADPERRRARGGPRPQEGPGCCRGGGTPAAEEAGVPKGFRPRAGRARPPGVAVASPTAQKRRARPSSRSRTSDVRMSTPLRPTVLRSAS